MVAEARRRRGASRLSRRRDRAGRGLRPHPSLQRPRPLRPAAARAAAADFPRDPRTGVVAPRPRARRAKPRGRGARLCRPGAPRRRDDARRPSRIAEPDRGFPADPRRRLARDLGVRALLCYGASERNFGREEARRGLEACRNAPASPLVRGLVGLHASFTVSDETIREAGALARALGTVRCTSMSPRTGPTSRTRAGAAMPGRSSG